MKYTHKVRTLAATLITIGSLAGGAKAALTITNVSASATDGLYVYTEGTTTDRLGIPSFGNDEFWTISVESPNILRFFANVDIGFSTATITFSGLEVNDNWASAVVSGTGGLPTLNYSGGDTALLNFDNGQEYYSGEQIAVIFSAVPEPSSTILVGLGTVALSVFRRRKL